jgi:integrase
MSIDKRPNGRWRARYRGLDGRERSKHFDRKADAIRYEATQKAAVARGDWLDPAAGTITFAEWAEEWLKTKSVQPGTLADYESIVRGRLNPRWGSYPLKRLGQVEIAQWVKELHDSGLRPATVRGSLVVMKMILKVAVESERLPKSPAAHLKAPQVSPRKPQVLTHEQVFTLARAAGEYETLILLLAYTGLRWGEATALKTLDIDLVEQVLHVDKAFSDVRGALLLGPTKTHQRRLVPLPRFLIPRLEDHLRDRPEGALVFTASGNTPLRLSNFRAKHFNPARRAARLPWVTPHALRHTAASLAIAAGADVKVVQAMLGHKTAAMTRDVYADYFPSNRRSVADRLSDAAEAAVGNPEDSNVVELPRRSDDDDEANRA